MSMEIPDTAFRLGETPGVAGLREQFGIEEEPAARLATALDRAAAFAASGGIPGRWSWALIGTPASGQVDAVITLDVVASSRAIDEYLDAAERAVPPGDVISRSVALIEVSGSPAVSVHELVAPEPGEGRADPASERTSLVIVPPEAGYMIKLKVTTQDMLQFDDITGWLLTFARTFKLTAGGRS